MCAKKAPESQAAPRGEAHDASSPAVEWADHLAASNLCRSAGILEGLARAIGVDEKTFVETIGEYNADAAAGGAIGNAITNSGLGAHNATALASVHWPAAPRAGGRRSTERLTDD